MKYEYMIFDIYESNIAYIVKKLNELGKEGWKAVTPIKACHTSYLSNTISEDGILLMREHTEFIDTGPG